jgi:hypothetical protein
MNRRVWNRKRAVITLAICAILAVSSILVLQLNQTTEAALIDPHPGLVGWWRFDEGTGNVASDSSGNGNDATISGATWVVDGKYGKAIRCLGGTESRVTASRSHSFAANVEGSYTFWWKWTGPIPTANKYIFVPATVRLDVNVEGNTGKLFVWFSDENNVGQLVWKSEDNRYVDGEWHFIAVSKSVTRISVYIDGENVGGQDTTLKTFRDAQTIMLGESEGQDSIFDEVRIYNRALSVAEIQENFQESPDFSSNLIAKIPKGTTQIFSTVSWQGTGSINVTVESPSQSYTEDTVSVYQKTSYSTSGSTTGLLNIKRLSISVAALSSDENWHIMLEYNDVKNYSVTVEVQK